MKNEDVPRRLPVVLPPHSDELLSSWISRHAAFYAVPPLVMLRHCLPEISSLRAADLQLSNDQEIRLANIFATEPAAMRRMTFVNVAQSSRRLIAARPKQVCTSCSPGHADPAPSLRSQLLGWRITCPLCGSQLRDAGGRELPSPFRQHRVAAVHGERLLDDEAERGIGTWTSPADIARLLLMRRIPTPVPREHDLWRFRVLGAIIPDLDHVIAERQENLPTPAKPILPLHLRPALLAGIAIVERAGPEMLRMLRGHMMGDNTTYGSARWAEDKEIQTAGLLGPDGVVLGRYDRDYLRHDGPEHVLCFAPTRSGKGVGLVVPTLLTWPGSCIVHDIKGENWTLTAGFRAKHGRVLLFDPTNTKSSAYNPLLEVRQGEWEVRDVQNIADILVDPEGSLDKRNHWEKTSHSLLVGAILHVLYAEPDKTLAGVANFLSDPKRPVEATLRAMMDTPHLGEAGVHPVIASSARELLNKSENERSGVLSTAMSFLGLYRDPVVARVTARCDWRIGDLVESREAVSLYLVVPPSDINRTKPLIRLVLNQVGRRLTEELKASGKRHRLLLMLDEFPALGRLDFFESALAFMAGYGLKSFLIAQSLNQIERAYGQNNAILDNCHVRIAFATNDERTAKRISDALGTATELRDSTNYAGHRLAPWLGHLMVSRQETARPLMTPGEIMQLPPTDEIVMVAGTPPVRAKKARYFEDTRFQERILTPPDLASVLADTGHASSDDWSNRVVAAASRSTDSDDNGIEGDPANAGIRREPELPEQEEIIPPPPPEHEFEFLDEEPDVDAAKARAMHQRMTIVARQASMNPDDGIEL